MNEALLELYRYNTWATLRLIEHCRGLADEHLDATIPGTFGTIRETLRHLVNSEEGYYSTLTRARFRTREEGAAFGLTEPRRGGSAVSLDELAGRIQRLGPLWEALAQDADLPAREVTTSDGYYMPAWIPMAQAVHHGNDHRSHIMSILGARGLDVPEPNGLDVWGYAESEGLMKEL
jgi:uncharacterized damage-inducible protein DinB